MTCASSTARPTRFTIAEGGIAGSDLREILRRNHRYLFYVSSPCVGSGLRTIRGSTAARALMFTGRTDGNQL